MIFDYFSAICYYFHDYFGTWSKYFVTWGKFISCFGVFAIASIKTKDPTPLTELTDYCVNQGLQLQFGGFESCRGGFRSVFKIALPDHTTQYHRSENIHTSIREAQNCAARVALTALQASGNKMMQ